MSNPALDRRPNAVVLLTHRVNPPGGPTLYVPRTLLAAYVQGRWVITHADGTGPPVGAAYDVMAYDEPSTSTFVHVATRENTEGSTTWTDNQFLNDEPAAVVFVTRRSAPAAHATDTFVHVVPEDASAWSLGGLGGARVERLDRPELPDVDHAIGVWYNRRTGRWNIFHQDYSPIPPNAQFSVDALTPRTYPSFFEHCRVVVAPAPAEPRVDFVIDPSDGPIRSIMLTQNISIHDANRSIVIGVRDVRAAYNDRATGLLWNEGTARTAVINEDGTPVPTGAGFNVRHVPSSG